jgi:drug/metabolite transporter (DMT)-like permease
MKPIIVWLILCVVWGTTWIFIKVGLDDLPPISFAYSRFIISLGVLLLASYFYKLSFPKTKKEFLILAFSGFLQFSLNYGLLFWGEQHISSGLAAVLQATIPAFGLFLAKIYLPEEEITFAKIASIILGLIGLIVIFYEQLYFSGTLAFFGSLAVVVGGFCAALASVLTKTIGQETKPANLVFWQMILGILPLIIYGNFQEGNILSFNWTKSAIICVLYLAIVGTVLAFWLYYWLLQNMDITKAMLIAFVTPLIAVIVGAAYRGEKLGTQTFLGGLFILASVGLVIFKPIMKRF